MIQFAYFGAYSLALVVFALLVRARLRHSPWGPSLSLVCVLAYVAGMFQFAHGFYYPIVLGEHENTAAAGMWQQLAEAAPTLDAVMQSTGGLWGGGLFVLGLLAAFLFVGRWPVYDKLRAFDSSAIGLAFALAICKLGCAAVGCCYGRAGEPPFAIHNTWGLYGTDLPRIPTQLLDLVGYTAIGVGLLQLARRERAQGMLILWFVVAYGLVRIATEFLRGDHSSPTVAGFSLVQIVLAGGVAVSTLLLLLPRAWRALWRARSDETRPPADATQTRTVAFLWLTVAASVMFAPLAVFLPVFAVVFLARLRSRERSLAPPASGVLLGALWLTAYFLPSLVPFAVTAGVFVLVLPFVFERDRAHSTIGPA